MKNEINQALVDCAAAIYDDSLLGSDFRRSTARIVDLVGAESALLFTPLDLQGEQAIFDPYLIPPDSFEDYAGYFAEKDIWMPLALDDSFRTGSVIVAERYVPRRHVLNSEFYNDFLKKFDIANVCCALVSDGREDDLPRTHFAVYRPDFESPFTDLEENLLRVVSETLRSAIALRNRLGSAPTPHSSLFETVECLPCKTIVLDAKKNVVHVNALAVDYLSSASWLRIQRGRLLLDSSSENDALHRVIDELLLTSGPLPAARGRKIVVESEIGEILGVLDVQRGPRDRQRGFETSSPLVYVFIDTPAKHRELDTAVLRKIFGLTASEAKLALALAAGLSLKAYAVRHSLSIHTVRTQLKQVFEKTHTHKQVELAGLLNRISMENT